MNKISLLTKINTVLIVLTAFFLLYTNNKTSKTVFIYNEKIFENFKMSKELKLMGESELSRQKLIVDSLYNIVTISSNMPRYERALKDFISAKEGLENFTTTYSTSESAKIWKRISTYSKEFIEENGYEIMLGAQAEYNIVAGNNEADVTNEFLAYINKRYDGQ